ncbi:MAG TPA: protein kinase [Terriglobia bacterium]|nr:protein kinase [Terriglobia bacterium]
MNCPYCNTANPEGSVRCAHCSQVMVNPGGTETLAAGAPVPGEAQPARRAQVESIGVLTPTPTPSDSGDTVSFGQAPSTAPGVFLDPGTNFGPRYQIEALLGRGGMGVVYKAYDRELDRTVALKLVRPDLTFDPESMRRFKQELLLASRVSHKNILRIHDLGDVDGVKFISMAYVEGEDLHHFLKQARRCPAEQVIAIGRQLAAALDAAHGEGVVHRDLKPQNVLLDNNGQAYVMDFGLAKSLEADASLLTHAGAVLGTPRYMSPEQVEGKPADARSDIYALGLILYEMATGELPFSTESVTQMMVQRLTQKPKDPKLVNPEVPRHLANVILRCLETNPANRYQSARAIQQDFGSGETAKSLHGRSSVQITLAVPESRRSRFLAAVVTLVLLAAIAAIIVYKLKHPSPGATEAGTGELPSLAQGKFVAVLPFHVLGNTSSLGYLAEGLDEAINAKLFALKGVHVASPGAVEQSVNKGSVAAIAKELGANLVLQGTLQGDAQKIVVVVSLQDVTGGKLLLAREFSGVPGDLLTLEDQISEALIGALELHPGNQELAREEQHPTENMAAYNLYLKGREALRGLPNAETIQKAMDYYKSALQQDSGFALAYAGLADANLRMYRQTRDRIWVDEATQAASQAQQLNSNLPEVYIALGNVYSATGKNAEAIQVLSRAVTLAPNSDEAYRQLGKAYQSGGQEGKAIGALKKAVQIDPYYWVNADELGKAYDGAGDYDKALSEFQRVTDLAPDNAAGHENIGNVYMQKGKFSQSVPALERALQLSPSFWHYSNLGSAYLYVKRYDDAAKMLEKAAEINPNQEILIGNLAEAYLFAGQKEKAHETFDKAISLAYGQLQVNPRDAETMGDLAIFYACEGQSEQALQFIRNARSIDPGNAQYIYDEAVVQAFTGNAGKAMQALREAFQKGFSPAQAASDPQLQSLQARTDFKQLVGEFSRTRVK